MLDEMGVASSKEGLFLSLPRRADVRETVSFADKWINIHPMESLYSFPPIVTGWGLKLEETP